MNPTDHQALSADVLAVVFHQVGVIDPKTLLFVVPAVCRKWRDVCQSHVLGVDIDLKLARRLRATEATSLFVTAVNAIVHRFHSVRAFVLNLHRSTPAAGVAAVAMGCPNLTHLNLASCENVTDAGLDKLAAGCPNLTSLDLNKCWNVTDAGLEKLAVGCPNLTSLNVGSCKNVTDAGIDKLASDCPNLTSLELNNCWRVTDAGLDKLAAGCPNMTSLKLGR
jgi:hypothetical protein